MQDLPKKNAKVDPKLNTKICIVNLHGRLAFWGTLHVIMLLDHLYYKSITESDILFGETLYVIINN